MTRVVHARFDGKSFHPEEPVPIAPDTPVILTIETQEPERLDEVPSEEQGTPSIPVMGEPYSSLKFAMSMNLEGPKDWSENLDEYLYRGKKFPDE
jgi:hypothetical protein